MYVFSIYTVERERERKKENSLVTIFYLFCRAPWLSRLRTRLENRRLLVRSTARPVFFPRTDDSHYDRNAFHSHRWLLFRRWLCGKAASGLEKILWLKELMECTDSCDGRHNITEIPLTTALKTIQSFTLSFPQCFQFDFLPRSRKKPWDSAKKH